MPALNFFRLYQNQKSNLLRLLEEKGIKHLQSRKVTYGKEEYTLSLYFSVVPKKSYVKWIKHLQEIFEIPDKAVDNYCAVMLIESPRLLYAVSFGVAHFFVSRFADMDFGVNIAARILSSYKIKNSREFGGKTTKSILTYDQIPELAFDGGESVNYIRGAPAEKEKWGNNVSCGQSV